MAQERVFDLGKLHSNSADLHLVVGPSEELEQAIRPLPHHIPGPVHAGTWIVRPGIWDECLGGPAARAHVAPGQAFPADVQDTWLALLDRKPAVIEHPRGHTPDWPADRDGIRCQVLF